MAQNSEISAETPVSAKDFLPKTQGDFRATKITDEHAAFASKESQSYALDFTRGLKTTVSESFDPNLLPPLTIVEELLDYRRASTAGDASVSLAVENEKRVEEETIMHQDLLSPAADERLAATDADKVFQSAVGSRKSGEPGIADVLRDKTEAEVRAIKAAFKDSRGVSMDSYLEGTLKPEAYAEFAKRGGLLNPIDKLDLVTERARLDNHAQKQLGPKDLAELKKDMKTLEGRKDIDKLSDDEIARTYREVSRLFESNGELPLDVKQRKYLAQQIMKQAANPTSIDQGAFKTCNVTTVETRTYTKHPSDAARLVADVALTRKYISKDGKNVVETDPKPKTDQARDYLAKRDGQRSHASEIFQVTAINLSYLSRGEQKRYEQLDIAPRIGISDNGARLLDISVDPPIKIGDAPGLGDVDIARLNSLITGTDELRVYFNSQDHATDNANVKNIRTEEELLYELSEAKAGNKFPVTVRVNTLLEPFYSDGKEGGAHVVNITDFEPGPNAKISIDNQWGDEEDHIEEGRQLDLKTLFLAMQNTEAAARMMRFDSDADRTAGKFDFNKELAVLRVRTENREFTTDRKYADQLKDLVSRATADLDKRGAGDNDLRMEKQKAADILTNLALDQDLRPSHTIELLKILLGSGLIDENVHDDKVKLFGRVAILREAALPGQKRTLEARNEFDDIEKIIWEMKQFSSLRDQDDLEAYISSLPEGRRKRIVDDLNFVKKDLGLFEEARHP